MADNYRVFKAAHLHSKFWTHNSVMVPGVRVVLNEDFVGIEDILRIPQQIHHFRVWWIIRGVSGMVCIPGEWNYAYVDGKYFHLVKGESNGFVKDVEGEWFFYSLIYDDWQNEWLTNNIHLKGTIDLTGDKELAMKKINMIPPLIENVNRFTHLNGILEAKDDVKYETIFRLPSKEQEVFGYPYYISSFEKTRINDVLRNGHSEINRGMRSAVPSLERLEIPLLYKIGRPTNGKGKFLTEIKRHHESGFNVYDVTVSGVKDDLAEILTKKMQSILHSDQLFTIASKENRVYTYARAINPTKGISEIDLSTCTDITFIDRNTLEPFGVDTMTKWKEGNTEKIIDWVIERQMGSGDALKNQMREAFEEVAYPALAPLLENFDENEDGASDLEDMKLKLFFDVGIEQLKANIVDTGDVRGEIKNPEGREWRDSRIDNAKEHRNFIWNNTTDLGILQGFIKGNPDAGAWYLKRDINYDELTEEQKKEARESAPKGASDRVNSLYYNYSHYKLNPEFNYFIYLYDEFKLRNGTPQDNHLDFSRNRNRLADWFGLIPDYHSMAFVPAFSFGSEFLKTEANHTHPRIILDYTKNSLHRDSVFCLESEPTGRCAIHPFVLREVKREESHDIGLDWKRASADFYDIWYNMGKDENDERWKGAQVLSRGYAFMELGHGDAENNYLRTTFLVGSSTCGNRNYCGTRSDHGTNQDYRFGNVTSKKPCPKFRKADRSGRAFPIEFTFPTKIDNFDVVAKLREFNDLPDNVLRWEVINTDIRKGAKPPINVRYLKQPKANADPEPTVLTDEEQAQIPPNTMVRIYMMNNMHPGNTRGLFPEDYSEDDKQFDLNEMNKYKTKTGKDLIPDIQKLFRGLCHYFFSENGEHYINNTGLPPGAIPNKIQVLSASQYPKNKAGQSQLALNYGKPYLGYGFMAGGSFYAPTPQDEIMLTAFETFNPKGTANKNDKDGLVTIIPNNYAYSGYFPQNIYQEKVNEMTSNNMMAFMYNGLVPSGVTNVNNVPASFGSQGNPFNPDRPEYTELEGSNYSKEKGNTAFVYNDEWVRYMKDKNTILLNDFIRHGQTWKSSKMLNPETLPYNMSYPTGEGATKRINSSTLNHDIPIYLVPLLDPTNPECALHQWQLPTPNLTTDAQRVRLFKEKIQNMVRVLLLTLESWPMWFKLEGTDGYASIKLNRRANQMHWDYELFTSNPQLIKTKDKEKWTFQNTFHGEDVDVLINSRYVLNVHGTAFNLKGRSFDKGEIIDVGLEIKAIEDEKQSIAAQWYSVEMNGGDVDVIKTIIEAPKELTKYTGFNPYEREKLIRELGFKYDEYLYEKEMLDVQRDYFKFMNRYQTDINYLNGKYTVGRGGARIAGGIIGVAENALNTAAGVATGGGFQGPTGAVGQYVYDKQRDLNTGERHPFEAVYSRYGRIRHGLTPPYREYIDMYQGRGRPRRNRRYGYYEMGSPHYLKNWELAQRYMADFRSIAGSLTTIAEGGMQIGHAYEQWGIESERIKAQYDNNERRLAAEGNFLNVKYEKNKENLLAQIYLQSTNTVRPAMHNNLIYKLYNKENKLKDVNMTVYYPGGKLAEYLKKFYTEFGYDIFERDVVCHGVDSFDRIIRFEFIYEIDHPNETIKEMIRSRAMMGVKVVEGIQ